MPSDTNKKKATVVPIRPAKKQMSDMKWGTAVMGIGFCIIPSLLLRAQQRG